MQALNKLLSAIITEEILGTPDYDKTPVTAITDDSRAVVPGGMFVAVRGPLNDGHRFIDDAIAKGASVIVAETLPPTTHTNTTFVRVADSAVALGLLASQWYDNPSRKLTLVGVTGTNGKTTTATLLYEMARLWGLKAGLLSTVENRVETTVIPTKNTTPSPLVINDLLAKMVDCGCTFAAMEVSSHGMVQHRTAGLHFSAGIFTNLTRDHLDYHGTFKAYLEAKKSFFDALPTTAVALTNADDRNGDVMLQNTRAKRFTYGLQGMPDFRGQVLGTGFDGMEIAFNGTAVHTPFIGRFNAANLTAVYATWVALGHDPMHTALTISSLIPVAGRFQSFRAADGTTVIVDYAHTPDALENVLRTINDVASADTVITVVTGAGGDRDSGKRPLMGDIASQLADRLIITSDNPRNENAADIAAAIAVGVKPGCRAKTTIILDRADAIADAVLNAPAGAVILIAGKGHENYQEFENHRRIHFDDREHAVDAINQRNQKPTDK